MSHILLRWKLSKKNMENQNTKKLHKHMLGAHIFRIRKANRFICRYYFLLPIV